MENHPQLDELSTARRVLQLARHEWGPMAAVALLGVLSAGFEGVGLALLIPLAELLDDNESPSDVPLVGTLIRFVGDDVTIGPVLLICLLLAFLFAGLIVTYANAVYSNVIAMRFAHHLRTRVFETALDRPVAKLESMPSGKLVNGLVSQTWRACDAVFVLVGFLINIAASVVLLAFLLMLSPVYTGVLMAMTVLMIVAVQLATRAVRDLGTSAVTANESFMAYVWDALAGLRVIRGFGREAHERRRFAEASSRVKDVFVRLKVISELVGPITQFITVGMLVTILVIAIMMDDEMATAVGFLAIAYRMQPRFTALLHARTQLSELAASVAEIDTLLSDRPAVRRQISAFPGLQRGIVFDGVSTRYPNSERPALHDISCSIPYGRVTAVAGQSGAGKSTLVSLLLRFIEPEDGRILVDGVPLSEISAESWHRQIAFVEQNAFLFNASIRENIGYGDLGAGMDAIREAARVAQAHDWIEELQDGYETIIGDHGVRLSQGQRQRIALARSVLRRPVVLILDEATNAIDRPTERALRAAIEARNERAVIVIAHRRETIAAADQVIVLDHGRIVETGTPSELARRGGAFARLYIEQPLAQGD